MRRNTVARLRAQRALGMFCHPECEYCWPYCHHALVAQTERAWREHNREEDLARELELFPFEETEVAQEDAFWCELYYSDSPAPS